MQFNQIFNNLFWNDTCYCISILTCLQNKKECMPLETTTQQTSSLSVAALLLLWKWQWGCWEPESLYLDQALFPLLSRASILQTKREADVLCVCIFARVYACLCVWTDGILETGLWSRLWRPEDPGTVAFFRESSVLYDDAIFCEATIFKTINIFN